MPHQILAGHSAIGFELFDIQGKRMMFERQLNELDVSALPSNMYLYRLTLDGEVIQMGRLVR